MQCKIYLPERFLFWGEDYIRHNHLLHGYTAMLESIAVVADMAVGVVIIDEEVVVIGKDVAGSEV